METAVDGVGMKEERAISELTHFSLDCGGEVFCWVEHGGYDAATELCDYLAGLHA